ncbi:hypothetical protein [Pseudomonas sp. NPDC099000]|uniref:hypothetical protein n=1 Tax=Pseudomonas sp. NPDC099000 TaxID=3364488 RepID=UPI00383A71D5
MKRTSLLPLLVVLGLGAVVIADRKVAVRNGTGEDVPNPMAGNNHYEPLFLRSRNEVHHDCAPCDKGHAVLDGEADLQVFETFNAQFINLRDH